MKKKFHVIKIYNTRFKNPIKIKQGETVKIGNKDDEFPGWIWCTCKDGKEGWFPEQWIDIDGENGVMNHDYDATELNVTVGEMVDSDFELNDWKWCTKPNGETGWVPNYCLEKI